METSFGRGMWNSDQFIRCYTHRYQETPEFTQLEDAVANRENPAHKEGYDNISLLTKEKWTAGTSAQIVCAFEGIGCPEIIIVPQTDLCEDDAIRYGACFEVVLWKNGFNVWRHYREEGRCFWHKRLGLTFPVAENEKHTLRVEVKAQYLVITVDGFETTLRVEDLPERFHMGITVCEGIARVYSLSVQEDTANEAE